MAAKIAMLHPGQIHGVVFVASSVDPSLEKTKFIQYLGQMWGLRWLIPNELRVCNEEILALKDQLTDMLDDWRLIDARTIIVHGEEDDLVPVANVVFIQQRLKTERTFIIKKMNHFIPWHRPAYIHRALEHLEKLD